MSKNEIYNPESTFVTTSTNAFMNKNCAALTLYKSQPITQSAAFVTLHVHLQNICLGTKGSTWVNIKSIRVMMSPTFLFLSSFS